MPESIDFQPLVTVYMPTYNRVELLRRAVDSVLTQDYKNIELIVVDDKSTDSTHEYLAKMAKKDSRFKYFINEKNSGACVSRNKAIFAAKGEFITGLDDDDYFLPNRVSSFVRFWYKKEEERIALYSHSYLIDSKKKRTKLKRISSCHYKDLICKNWIGNQLFTKTIYLKNIDGFDTRLLAWQDLECWYNILKKMKGNADLLPLYTYIIDQSHPHERISIRKKEKILDSYEYICQKHRLNKYERNILSLQLTPYVNTPPKLSAMIDSILYIPRLYNINNNYQQSKSLIKRLVTCIYYKI